MKKETKRGGEVFMSCFLLEVFYVDSLILWQQTIKLSPQRALGHLCQGHQVFHPLVRHRQDQLVPKEQLLLWGTGLSIYQMLHLSYNETPRLLVKTKQK